jgi:nicotinamide-nucleotide amidase
MVVELICVGTELLLGNIVNTNAAYLAEQCAALGLSCYYQSVVGDNEERLAQLLENAVKRSDVVILSGGLGPTEDDLTKEVAARVMGKELVMDEDSRQKIVAYFGRIGAKSKGQAPNTQPTENNWKQAMIPKGALVLENPNGTAPGVILHEQNTHVILLPGPPGELIPMFEDSVAPYLNQLESGVILSKTVKICGIGESRVETMIKDLIAKQANPTIATYAKTREVHIRVTGKAPDVKQAKKLLRPVVQELKERFGTAVYTTKEGTNLEQVVEELLCSKKLTLTCAESCTGGLLSARLVNVPGISKIYKNGWITYSNKAKRRQLGVKKSTLRKFGAVSSKTAREMALGAALAAKADVAVAVTGIAGPDGGTNEKPVGLTYIACSVRGCVTVEEYHFAGNRQKVRESAACAALVLLRSCILNANEDSSASGPRSSDPRPRQ